LGEKGREDGSRGVLSIIRLKKNRVMTLGLGSASRWIQSVSTGKKRSGVKEKEDRRPKKRDLQIILLCYLAFPSGVGELETMASCLWKAEWGELEKEGEPGSREEKSWWGTEPKCQEGKKGYHKRQKDLMAGG